MGPGLYRKLREVKGFISSKFGPDPTYWGRVMTKNVKSVFINFLNSRFSPFLLVSGGPGAVRKLGEACRNISSEYGPDWSRNFVFSALPVGIGHVGAQSRILREFLLIVDF